MPTANCRHFFIRLSAIFPVGGRGKNIIGTLHPWNFRLAPIWLVFCQPCLGGSSLPTGRQASSVVGPKIEENTADSNIAE